MRSAAARRVQLQIEQARPVLVEQVVALPALGVGRVVGKDAQRAVGGAAQHLQLPPRDQQGRCDGGRPAHVPRELAELPRLREEIEISADGALRGSRCAAHALVHQKKLFLLVRLTQNFVHRYESYLHTSGL